MLIFKTVQVVTYSARGCGRSKQQLINTVSKYSSRTSVCLLDCGKAMRVMARSARSAGRVRRGAGAGGWAEKTEALSVGEPLSRTHLEIIEVAPQSLLV